MAREMEETSSTIPSFPPCCSLLKRIFSVCAGCLGFSSHDAKDPSDKEDGTTATEDRSFVRALGSSSPDTGGRINSVLLASRSPQQPPPSEGRGGQTNSGSS